ncbi:glutathione S-transferase omega-like 2 [Monosporozyma unispora]|nr:S-glutathionyl-(chloro)hydroquinone reductase [Kazachstania unispora]
MSKQWADSKDGAFKRQVSAFKEIISPEHPVYKPAAGRYWLYVSLACPWAHRTLITRVLKGLTSVIGVSVVHWHLDEKGWRLAPAAEAAASIDKKEFYTPSGGITTSSNDASGPVGNISNDSSRLNIDSTFDPINGFNRLSELYYKSEPNYNARFTVPVLWDTETNTIVNNESASIIRTFDSGVFDEFIPTAERDQILKLVPKSLEAEIDEFNAWVYDNVNNGVYKAGFAENPSVYEKEVTNVFAHLDKIEKILKDKYEDLTEEFSGDTEKILSHFFTIGDQLTEADVRLYTTIIRFDPVYVQHFKCNFTTIRDGYPKIHLWLRNLYWNYPAFRETTNFEHIKLHYTRSHTRINPLSITPLGPKPDIRPL